MRLIKFKCDGYTLYVNPLEVTRIETGYDRSAKQRADDKTVIVFKDGFIHVDGDVETVAQKFNDELNKLAINNVETLTIN